MHPPDSTVRSNLKILIPSLLRAHQRRRHLVERRDLLLNPFSSVRRWGHEHGRPSSQKDGLFCELQYRLVVVL